LITLRHRYAPAIITSARFLANFANFNLLKGYRKVAGDSCEKGVDHSPLRLPCPGFEGFFTKKNFVIILALALIAGVIYNSRV